MGLFKKFFSDAADELKKSLEETKKEMRNSLEEMKQNAMAGFADGASKYARKLKDYEARLREMPEDKKGVYGEVSEGTPSEKTIESRQKEPVAQENVVSGLTQLDGLVQQIKERIQSQGLSVFVLYANDYEGDREYEEVEQLGDEGLLESSSEYAINYNESYDGYSSVYTKVRKIEVQDSGVTFDIEEIYEDNDGNEESRGFHEAQTIDRILESCNRDTVERGLENILTYLNDETLIKLNKNTGNESMPDPVSEPKAEPETETKVEVEQKGDPIENGGLFSARLEAMIAAALQDGVLTDKEREILKRRVEKEGEDWDEVEMIIEARLAEIRPTSQPKNGVGRIAVCDKDTVGTPSIPPIETKQVVNVPILDDSIFDRSKAESCSNERNVDIPEGYTEIEEESFLYNDKLQSICLPSTLNKVGRKAFAFCSKLKRIDFSKCSSLQEIEDEAFGCCQKLEEIALPDSITIIGDGAFNGCEKLEEIVLPDSITIIGDHAFLECYNLRKVVMPSSLEKLGDDVFDGCESLEEVDMSKVTKLTTIPSGFETGNEEQMVIPMGVTTIRKDAFKACSKYALFLPPTLKDYMDKNGNWESVYLFASPLERMDNIFENSNNLYVLPQYLEEYKSIHEALGEYSWCKIHTMPDEYLFFYDN